ncbi:MAG: HAD family hydrolase [Candidatus Protochlamydia sp.]|nr:HAD family hydrolase [Candidatus Protochlamydia sp.]
MAIVFDLDDTLYPELSFVYSGYKAVSAYLSPLLNLPPNEIEAGLKAELKIKRDQVFDRFLQEHNFYSRSLVKKCLSLYRGHVPTIQLYSEALECLKALKENSLFVVTDGNKLVQQRKYQALELGSYIKKCFCTYAYGIHRSKPSPYCFERICQLEKIVPSQVVYVADNPYKDFVGIKPLGFKTVRVLTGPYRDCKVEPAYEADEQIDNLSQLEAALKMQLWNIY